MSALGSNARPGCRPPKVDEGFEQSFVLRRATNQALHGLDFILSPVNSDRRYPMDHASPSNDPARPLEHICFTVPRNLGEQPVASIHCGMTTTGMTIGLQIIGHRFDDLGVMHLARRYEEWQAPPHWPRFDEAMRHT